MVTRPDHAAGQSQRASITAAQGADLPLLHLRASICSHAAHWGGAVDGPEARHRGGPLECVPVARRAVYRDEDSAEREHGGEG